MSPFVVTPLAKSDLERIEEFLSGQSATAWPIMSGRFADAFRRIGEVPGIGHRRTDLTRRLFLFLAVESYMIVYDPRHRPVHILRVVHGARDVRRTLDSR